MPLEKQVKQLEFEFMKKIEKEEKRRARTDTIAVISAFIISYSLMGGMLATSNVDESKIIKKDYSETIEKVPFLLRPYISVGFPYF